MKTIEDKRANRSAIQQPDETLARERAVLFFHTHYLDPHLSRGILTETAAFVIYITLAFAQMAPFGAAMKLWGFGGIASFFIFLIGIHLPLGATALAVIAFYGAYAGWHWEWWQAAALTLPFAIFGLITSSRGGLMSFYVRPWRR